MTMDQQQARELVRQTFEADFNREQFAKFIRELCKSADFSKATGILSGQVITRAFQDKVRSYERIAQHTDIDGNKIDILIVNLRRDSSLERARTSLRNFAADYLNSERGFGKAGVLVAYAAKDEKDYFADTEWRFSYATLEKELAPDESGKFKEKTTRQLPARRYSFLVGANEQTHTAQTQFIGLLRSQSAPTLKQIEEAFSVEKVTVDFYKDYEKLFKRTSQEIKALRAKNDKLDAHLRECCIEDADFAKKLLGQIVFLYFLQRKGWFGIPPNGKYGEGDKRYLRRLFTDRSKIVQGYTSYDRKSTSFFNTILEPLFYQALSTPNRHNDIFPLFNAKIPFLNGGLFEAKYDYDTAFIELPDELFSNREQVSNEEDAEGILDVFDRYNFTVNEAERLEKEVAIDPEMLGHVFENLLVKEERGQSGTFYTPQIIVSYMCRQSLLEYLATHLLHDPEQQTIEQEKLTREALEKFIAYAELDTEYEEQNVSSYKDRNFSPSIRKHAKAIDDKLCDIKVCDPAIGSGAFPVGILQEIVRLRSALLPAMKKKITENKDLNDKQRKADLKKIEDSHTPYKLKLNAIENSIYGVDKEQSAVDIARLRLWLSLIVDEDDMSEDKSLPNLDYKIVQGNSLLNEFEGLELIPPDFVVKHSAQSLLPNQDRKVQLQKLQPEYFAELSRSGKDSIEAHRIFRQIESLNKQIAAEKKSGTSAQSDWLQNAATGKDEIKALAKIHQQIFQSKDKKEKDKLRRQADEIILEFINDHLTEGTTQLQQELTRTRTKLTEEIANVRQKMKADLQTPKIKSLTKTLESLESSLQQRQASQLALKNLWETNPTQATLDLTEIDEANFTTSKPKDFTLWELQFVEMFFDAEGEARANGGFDVLIANPPYIRSGKISREHKLAFSRRYSTFEGNTDIYVYFYEKGVDLLRNQGALTFITSNSFLNSGFGARLRNLLKHETQINQLIDFAETGIFDATVETCIVRLSKNSVTENKIQILKWDENETLESLTLNAAKHSFAIEQSNLKEESWQLEQPEILHLLEKLKTRGIPLGEYVEGKFYYGIKTGLNEAFVVSRAMRDQLIAEHPSSAEVLKPFLRGRDIKRWQAIFDDQYLIKIESSSNIEHLWSGKPDKEAEKIFAETHPAIYQRFNDPERREGLIKREDQGAYFWELRACIYWEEFEKPKIVYQDIARYFGMAWDDSGAFLANTCYFIPTDEKFLLGVLLSSTIRFWVEKMIGSDEGGFIRLFSIHVGKFPIPSAQDWQKEIIEKFVEYILFLTKTDSEKLIVNYFESILNALVYELFLPDELHAAGKEFFAPLRAEALPTLEEISGDKLSELQNIRARLSQPNHLLQQNLSALDRLESVRIIAGKA